MYNPNIKLVPIPFPGFPAPIWFRNIDVIGQLIEKNGLAPISKEYIPRVPAAGMDMEFAKMNLSIFPEVVLPRWGDHGGIRGPHLHYNGMTFIVNEKLWAEFTKPIVAEFKAKMERVNSVDMEQLQQIDELAAGLMGR